ncbi:hypothetical protein JYG23_12100 [Sedimentibacter sp. zth1]|uniref:hypothetical protein n=1 Tax=Sedimentibacter sp. zth1 TaxID=2816908 RepID=UPI001A92B0D6|nr:hypothetical protein [Sedimentibacter sp. zth1]QSX05410.1 hypothetical protein JYG23_12100 [Sedimentibacter sp. zth1]
MRFLIVDFKRGLTEKNFHMSLILGIICVLGSIFFITANKNDIPLNIFISAHGLVLPFVAPFLAAIAYSNMNMIEKDFKYDLLMSIRQKNASFEIRRFLVNGIISGLAIVIPIIFLFIIYLCIGVDNLVNQIIGVIILDFIFGFAFGSLSYALTFVNTKKYIPVVAPEVIYLLLIYSFPHLGLEVFYPPLCFSPWILPMYANGHNIIILLSACILFSLMIVIIAKVYNFVEFRRAGGK